MTARPWSKHYPPGVSSELGNLEFATLPQMIEESANKYGSKVAFQSLGSPLSFTETLVWSEAFGVYLQRDLGLKKGDRVAVMMPNMLAYPVVLFGILRAGLIVVSVNPLYTARELENQLKDSGASAIVLFEGAGHVLQQVLATAPVKHVVLTSIGDLMPGLKGVIINFVIRKIKNLVPAFRLAQAVRFKKALAQGESGKLNAVPMTAGDLAFLQYTGGTTGVSKGAALSHRNVLANIEQMRQCSRGTLAEGAEICITALPLYHIAALVLNGFAMFRMGGTQILIANPRDIGALIKVLATSKFTYLLGVNTLYNALLNHPDLGKVDFSTLHLSCGGAAAIQQAVADRWKERTGKLLLEGYGLSETSGAATINPTSVKEFNGTVGIPVPGCDVEIRDDKGAVMPYGEPGQIFVRGPHVMTGYWQKPTETAAVLGADGFLATGDVGTMTEDGFVKIVDRVKDMILVSGFNVYPNEVEDVLVKCPGVLEAAAIGVPDANSGEAVKAFVVKKDASITVEQVMMHCRAQLTGYKVPRQIEFISALPKSPVGKVLRRELRPKQGV